MRRKTGHVDLFPIGYKQCAIVFDKVLTFQQLSKTIRQLIRTIPQNYSTIIFFRQFDINNSTKTVFRQLIITIRQTAKHLNCFRQFIITVQHEAKLFNNVMKNTQH